MKKLLALLLLCAVLCSFAACAANEQSQEATTTAPVTTTQEPTEPATTAPATEPPTQPPTAPPTADWSDKAVYHIQTDALKDDAGRWLVDFGVGDFKEASDSDVTFVDSKGWFNGSGLSMLAKPNADYNLFWQVDPEGLYAVDTALDPATATLTLWLYVEDIDTFYDSGWTEIDIGSGGWFGEEWACWQLKDEWINEGWNYLELPLAEADENTGVDISRLRWFRFCYVGAAEGTEFRVGDINLISDLPAEN